MMTYPSMTCGEAETDQILVPVATGYQVHPLTQLFGWGYRRLRAWEGMGLAPLHFIVQRGPLQDGESVLDMRFDPRTVQIVIAEPALGSRTNLWDRKADLYDLLRPNRSFNGTVKPLIYRKQLPHGKIEKGTDLETDGTTTVTSHIGRFVERGLEAGQAFHITTGADVGTYTITGVPNDYTVILDTAPAATATNVHWRYARGRGVRDLYCLLAEGPAFNQGPGPMPGFPNGYREVLRFIAHDPFWYGAQQSETWGVASALGDLVFDTLGGWVGSTAGTGRWLFAPTFVGETVQVIYWGTRFAKPVITITGPAENPVVENTTINARIAMDYIIALGETVTIDTQAITVTNQAGTNLMPYTGGDLTTFGLYPPPQAPDRSNAVYVSFSSGLAGTSAASMTWRNRHVGLSGG